MKVGGYGIALLSAFMAAWGFAVNGDFETLRFRAAEVCGVANARISHQDFEADTLRNDRTCVGIREKLRKEYFVAYVRSGLDSSSAYPKAVCVQYKDHPSILYVAFPGWTGFSDSKTLLSVGSTLLETIGMKDHKGHIGLFRTYLSMRAELIETIDNIRKAEEGRRVNTLVFTGHCMGAGVATYAYVDFAQNYAPSSCYLKTFAPLFSVMPRTVFSDYSANAENFWLGDDLFWPLSSCFNWLFGREPIASLHMLSEGAKASFWNTYRLARYRETLRCDGKKQD